MAARVIAGVIREDAARPTNEMRKYLSHAADGIARQSLRNCCQRRRAPRRRAQRWAFGLGPSRPGASVSPGPVSGGIGRWCSWYIAGIVKAMRRARERWFGLSVRLSGL